MVVITAISLSAGATATGKDDFPEDAGGRSAATGDPGRGQLTGNVIFIHPDGTGANQWGAGRLYWQGPDEDLNWDRLPEMTVYRGHMADVLTGTSNGGATTHAFGYKVEGAGSFGMDGNSEAEPPTDRSINSLSEYPGSIMREAGNAGHPVGVLNDGDSAEPGTGAFLAEVGNRDDLNEINLQVLTGRPGTEDVAPAVILGGGEANYLPEGTPVCGDDRTLECAVHTPQVDPVLTPGARTDGRNLLQEARDLGYRVIRTRAEFDRLQARLRLRPNFAPKVLGLFSSEDIFNDVPEEALTAAGLVDPTVPADDRGGNLVLFGSPPNTPGYDPPTVAELGELATTILERRAERAGKPFMLVAEPESTDNFGNNNNAIGTLTALRHADELIGVARGVVRSQPETLVLTAADSDGGGMQVVGLAPDDDQDLVGTEPFNDTTADSDDEELEVPLDGLYGRGSAPFRAQPDQFGQELPFAVSWSGRADVSGGIVSRAEGLNAELLRESFSDRFDNIDVYRLMYLTLFDEALPYPDGERAPERP
jgi:alkaline phosphatase